MQSVYRKSFQTSEKFENGPSVKRATTADSFTRPRSQRNRKVPEKLKVSFNNMASDFVAVGSEVKVLWTEKEVEDTRPEKRGNGSVRTVSYTCYGRWHH